MHSLDTKCPFQKEQQVQGSFTFLEEDNSKVYSFSVLNSLTSTVAPFFSLVVSFQESDTHVHALTLLTNLQ